MTGSDLVIIRTEQLRKLGIDYELPRHFNHDGVFIHQGSGQFMERKVSKEILDIQQDIDEQDGFALGAERWIRGLILKLLDTTQGQWLYRNM